MAATNLYDYNHNLNVEDQLQQQYEQHKQTYNALKINFSLFYKTNKKLHHEVVN